MRLRLPGLPGCLSQSDRTYSLPPVPGLVVPESVLVLSHGACDFLMAQVKKGWKVSRSEFSLPPADGRAEVEMMRRRKSRRSGSWAREEVEHVTSSRKRRGARKHGREGGKGREERLGEVQQGKIFTEEKMKHEKYVQDEDEDEDEDEAKTALKGGWGNRRHLVLLARNAVCVKSDNVGLDPREMIPGSSL
eukprot:303078-Hanusia_phi.AAC.3